MITSFLTQLSTDNAIYSKIKRRFKVDENDGYTLWRVILFKKALEEFQNYCRQTQKYSFRMSIDKITGSLSENSSMTRMKSKKRKD
jgi:V-ATPase subunit C.